MSSEEFLYGPMQSGLFDQIETAIILGHILKHPVDGMSPRITPQILDFLKRSRCTEPYSPIPLSTRTKRKVTNKSLVSNKFTSKKEKKKKNDDQESESKCFNYTLNVLASIFD